jgi:PAS domain S-box-containing protein
MNVPVRSNRWGRMAFRLPALIALFAALAGLFSGGIAYYVAHDSYVQQARDRMDLVRNERSRAVLALINEYRIGLASLATRPAIGEDISTFSDAMTGLDESGREALITLYTTGNPFPSDSRAAITDAGDASSFTAKHRTTHERFLRLLQIKELDDLLLVDSQGNVVYTVMKDMDFGSNLLSGSYSTSNAAKVFREAVAAQPPWNQTLADMAQYGPTASPAMFMGQAVRNSYGTVVGVLMFRLNNDKLRDAANHIQDLGDTGEVYLVGPDATRRSQTRFAHGELITEKVTTEAATRSTAGFSDSVVAEDYKGDIAVSAYAPIDLMGVRWGIISKIDLSEALAPLRTMVLATTAGIIFSTLLIAYLGYTVARRISRPLDRSLRVMEKLSRGDLDVDIDDTDGGVETRQIAASLRAFRANLIETQRLISEVTDGQAQMTGLLDSSPTGIVVLSEENEVLFINDPGAQILGKRKSTFIGEKFSFANIAVDEAEAARIIGIARRDGIVKEAQLTIHGPQSDAVLNISARRTSFRSRDAYLIWFYDMTDALRANAELRDLSARFVTLLENIPDLTTIQDRELRFQAASQSVARAFGLHSWRDVIGKKLADIWQGDPENVPAETVSEEILAGKVGGSSGDHQDFLKHDRWLSTNRTPIRNERGEIIGLLSISRDITEHKQLRDQLEQALADSKNAQVRTEAILAGAPDSIFIVRSDSAIEYANEQVRKVLGYEPEELIGKRIETLIPERFRIGHQSQVRGYFDEGEVRRMGAGRELFVLARDGREIPVEIALSPIRSGEKPVVVAILRDVTEQKKAERIVLEAREAAEAATKAKSDFLASMSHEIRTPMNGIIGMADLLAQADLDDDKMHMIRTIRESGNALITVINDILDLSKIEAGKLSIEDVTMSIIDAVEGVASTLTPTATQKGLRIHAFVDPALPEIVHGDPTRLRQILFNLGGNAVKFSDGKDIQIRAHPTGGTEDGMSWVRFSVIDQGIGISEANQQKLFKAFSQAESSTTRKFGGTGLGLAICKNLIEMMGGKISLESQEGKGSTFSVDMPFKVVAEAKSNLKERDLSSLHIMLVGSEPPRQDAIVAYLRHAGAEVTLASHADAALTLLAGRSAATFDSVMLDMGLKREQQDEMVIAIRKAAPAGSIKIILLQDYQNRGARIADDDLITVDANPLLYYRVVSAAAVAAGRASPQIRNEGDVVKLVPKKAPSIKEAEAQGRLILLAEDNPTNQDVIRRQVNMLGHACQIVNNGEEALAEFQTGRYALILTDCHMPVMDGYELTERIRALERHTSQHIPIIAVTANALQGEAERCLRVGMDDYISKPIPMPALIAALGKWMPTSPPDRSQAEKGKAAKSGRSAGRKVAAAIVGPATRNDSGVLPINERAIKDVFGDDEATFKEILRSFVDPSRAIIDEIGTACEVRAAGNVKGAAHKLKSAARAIGADSLADLCATLENAGHIENWAEIDSVAARAREEFRSVESFIDRLCAEAVAE